MKLSVARLMCWVVILMVLLSAGAPAVTSAGNASVTTGLQSAEPKNSVQRILIKLRTELDAPTGRLAYAVPTTLTRALMAQDVTTAQPLFHAESGMPSAIGLERIYRLELAGDADVNKAVAALSANPDIEWAEPDYVAHVVTVPDDPLYGEQWGLAKIDAPTAWNIVTGTQTVVIAVVDSGIDLTHPDLQANLWINPGEIAGNGIDDDNNGYVDDVRGWNFVNGTNNVYDGNGHGTQVAGVAAAVTNNSLGIAGVCWNCKIMPVRVMADSGISNYSDIALGVQYAARKGAKVINLSLGGYSYSNALRDAIDYAVNERGAVVVGGAGNDNVSTPFYPAAYDNVLAVAGTTSADTKATFSDYGTWVDISAPSVEITTTYLGGDWGPANGTSLATPFVTGVAALIRSQRSDWSAALVRNQLLQTADDIDALNPAYAGQLGVGRVNAAQATQDPHPILVLAGTSVNGDPTGRPAPGETATLAATLRNDWWDATGVTGTLTTIDPYVILGQATASYGDLASGATGTSSPVYSFTVAAGAGYNHPMPFILSVSANDGAYTVTLPFTITTRSGDEHFCGTVAGDIVWTNDKTYILDCNVGIAPGYTLTIKAGTEVHFNGNYNLNVGGALIADGTASQPIRFMPHTGGSWGRIFFDDPSVDALASSEGIYQSGNLLRHVHIESAAQGIDCTNATPFLDHVTLDGGGMNCAGGDTELWVKDSDLSGGIDIHGSARIYNNNITDGYIYAYDWTWVQGNRISGPRLAIERINVGQGFILSNSVNGGIYASGPVDVRDNTLTGGGIYLDSLGHVQGNEIREAEWAIRSTSVITAIYNRVIGNRNGIQTSGGTVKGNLIANISDVGLEIGSATVEYNTFTGIGGNAIKITSGTPGLIVGNNFEFNTGTYDIEDLVAQTTLATVDARNNWWATTSETAIRQRIWDFSDDYNLGTVLYSPVLTRPSTIAPAYIRAVTLTPESPVGIQTVAFDVEFSREMDTGVTPQLTFINPIRWAARNPMPTAREGLSVAVASNGKLYAIGGSNGSYLATLEEYDPTTDVWTDRTSMPTARYGLGVATAPNGKLYAIGGNNNGPLPTVEEYDPTTDTWIARAPMPTARQGLAVATASNGKLYAIGGYSDGLHLATVEEYDPTTDTWTTRASMPTPRYFLGVAIAPNGKIYAIGGYSENSGHLATVEEYDPATDAWTARASMLTARIGLGAAAAPNGKLYAIGGSYQGGYSVIVEEYDPATDAWTYSVPLPTARSYLAVAAAPNGKLYAIGGYDEGERLTTVEELTPWLAYTDFYGASWLAPTQFRALYDFSTLIPRDTYTITVSGARTPQYTGSGTGILPVPGGGMEIVPNSAYTFTVDYAGYINDTTAPPVPTVTTCAPATPDVLSATWSAYDPDSAIDRYQYAIGVASGSTEVVDWTFTPLTETTRVSLTLVAGQTYYFSVKARNEAGLWSEAGSAGIVAGSDTCVSTEPTSPIVDFTATPRSGYAPLEVQFSSIITGEATSYAWAFGDGGIASTANPTHTYTSAGNFGVTLVVTGPSGTAQVVKPAYITVNPSPGAPTATFSADVVSGTVPFTVNFTAVTSGTVEGWLWTFGDGGETLAGPIVQHTYQAPGVFDVSLTVSNTHGSYTVNKPDYITVTEPPIPAPEVDFTGTPRSGDAPLTIQFTSTVTNAVSSYAWSFGDGGIASTANPTHTYTGAGSFGVSLVVTGPGGTVQAIKPVYITVNPPPGAPTATFSANVVSGTVPFAVTFTAVTSGTVESWHWTFDDSTVAFTGPVVQHTYQIPGVFDVSLTVSNTHGSYTVNKLGYITVSSSGGGHRVYLPLVLRH